MGYYDDLDQNLVGDILLETPVSVESDFLMLGLGAASALVIGYALLHNVCLSGRKRNCWFPCDPVIFQCEDKVLTYTVTRKFKTRH